jgi:Secretion system C-terminal sorting domain/Metallo-peptidase family M12
MKKLLLGISMLLISVTLKSQTCESHLSYEEYLNKLVNEGRLTQNEGEKRLLATKKGLLTRSNVVNVLLVYQNVSRTDLLLSTAQDILQRCVGRADDCQITYNQVNATPLNFVFSKSKDGLTVLSNLIDTATVQGWYTQETANSNGWSNKVDLVVGITNTDIIEGSNADLAGYAFFGGCSAFSTGPALIVESNTTQYVFAHELGHTVGMRHDNNVSSIMNPIIYTTANTMGLANRNCYAQAGVCGNKVGVDVINIPQFALTPNPINDNLTILFDSEIYAEEVAIYDVLGRLISRYKNNAHRFEINTQDLMKGLYFVEVTFKGKKIMKKVMKLYE